MICVRREIRSKASLLILILFMLLLSFSISSFGAEPEVVRGVSKKEVTGRINGLGEDFVSLVLGRKNSKIYALSFLFDSSTEIIKPDNIERFNIGELVNIEYEEVIHYKKEPQEVTRRATKIRFIETEHLESKNDQRTFD